MADDTTEQELRNLQILQSMIDVSAERLEGLRTQCATSAELTQQEIRTLEVRIQKPHEKKNEKSKNKPTLFEPYELICLTDHNKTIDISSFKHLHLFIFSQSIVERLLLCLSVFFACLFRTNH